MLFELLGVPPQALFAQLLLGLINGSFYALLSLGLAFCRLAVFAGGHTRKGDQGWPTQRRSRSVEVIPYGLKIFFTVQRPVLADRITCEQPKDRIGGVSLISVTLDNRGGLGLQVVTDRSIQLGKQGIRIGVFQLIDMMPGRQRIEQQVS
jgi:hypothetical protein